MNDSWFKNNEFIKFVDKEWKEIKVEERSDNVIKEKFKNLKDRLRRWNKETFGWIDLKVDEGVKVINKEENILSSCVGHQVEELMVRRSSVVSTMWRNLAIKDNMLLQKSSLKWVRDGDLNRICFHNFVKEKNRKIFIGSLNTNKGLLIQ